jgi:hypothetical protein
MSVSPFTQTRWPDPSNQTHCGDEWLTASHTLAGACSEPNARRNLPLAQDGSIPTQAANAVKFA